MTTPLFLLRCVQLGLSMADTELLSIGLVNDMYTEQVTGIGIVSWGRRRIWTGSEI